MSERYVLSDNGFVVDMGYTTDGEGEEVMANEIVERLNALEARLEAMERVIEAAEQFAAAGYAEPNLLWRKPLLEALAAQQEGR